jgi:hypothetical protein
MRKLLLIIIAALFALAAPAQARGLNHAGSALERAGRLSAVAAAAVPSCPAGVPVQTITVINQANVRPWALAKVERAMVDQSLQLRAAWGTPCVQFAGGGWPLYLWIGGTVYGYHYTDPIRMEVYTGGYTSPAWSETFSHEIVETLVDPSTGRSYYDPYHWLPVTMFGLVEVADPVEERGYRLDAIWVSDFVLPAYFAGAADVPPTGCNPPGGLACGPLLATADSTGPYDEMGILTGPWQTTWERPTS